MSNKKQSNNSKQQNIIETSGNTCPKLLIFFCINKQHTERIITEIMMDGKSFIMEVDTGAAVIIIGRNTFK